MNATGAVNTLWQRRFWEHLICDEGDFGHHVEIFSGAECAVQVHDMDPVRAGRHEAFRHRNGIIPINGLPRRLTLTQANDAAGSNIDGGKEIHYRRYGNHRVGDSAIWPASAGTDGVAWCRRATRRSRSCSNRLRLPASTDAPFPRLTLRESLATPFILNS